MGDEQRNVLPASAIEVRDAIATITDADQDDFTTVQEALEQVTGRLVTVEAGSLPAGGTDGQVLTKVSSTDGDADWEDPASGASGVAPAVEVTTSTTLDKIHGSGNITVVEVPHEDAVLAFKVAGDAKPRMYIIVGGSSTGLWMNTGALDPYDDDGSSIRQLSNGDLTIGAQYGKHITLGNVVFQGTIDGLAVADVDGAIQPATTVEASPTQDGIVVTQTQGDGYPLIGIGVVGDDHPRLVLGPGKIFFGDGASEATAQIFLQSDGVLRAYEKMVATEGLGAGNSVAATTPGTVVKKMEIFDETGASLGYIPIYDAIT